MLLPRCGTRVPFREPIWFGASVLAAILMILSGNDYAPQVSSSRQVTIGLFIALVAAGASAVTAGLYLRLAPKAR